jgi:hypothetical protein
MHAVHFSIPIQTPSDADVYRAKFAGVGLGWFSRDYRGRKVVQHGGAWGADVNLVPEEKVGVVVLSNRDWNSLVWMLSYDVIDAYVAASEQVWLAGEKWDHWLKLGGPNAGDADLQLELARLKESRRSDTKPSLPLDAYSGVFQTRMYSDLSLNAVDGRLVVKFGDYTARLEHWEHDTFYGHAVIEPFFDWLVKFDVGDDKSVKGLEIIHLGWKDPDERFLFSRKAE